ncbi:MAG: hypothetical protein JWR74_816 [Polaromonas sp.]|nr:hypothetical protein [Polaromonas sp.]
MTLTRRTLLSSAALVPLVAQAGLLDADRSEAIFADTVGQVAGVSGLAPVVLSTVREAFVSAFGGAALTALAHAVQGRSVEDLLSGSNAALGEQIRFIALMLFTGEVQSGGQTKVTLYPWSLAWATLGFSKAPGLCGGPAFGHWAHAQ